MAIYIGSLTSNDCVNTLLQFAGDNRMMPPKIPFRTELNGNVPDDSVYIQNPFPIVQSEWTSLAGYLLFFCDSAYVFLPDGPLFMEEQMYLLL